MALLGLDLGSSSIKGVVFGENGEVFAEAQEPFTTVWNESSAEADAEEIWQSAVKVIKTVAAEAPDIEAICAGSHGETYIPVDSEYRQVYPAVMNSDNRAVRESKSWEASLGKRKLYEITGVPLHPMFSINKIMWLKNNRPDVFMQAAMFLSPQDYMLGRLGVKPLIDFSLASRTMAFDINRHRWSGEILKEAGVSEDMMPECVPTGTTAGKINDNTAKMLGLKKGVKAVVGGHDQPLAALGCGAISEGQVSDSAGTFECLAAISDVPKNNDKAYHYNLNSYCHVVNGKYVTLAFFPAGVVTSWFVDEFCYEDKQKAAEEGISEYLYISQKMDKAPTGICVTPHLIGSCNPYWDMRARGAIYGLAPDTSRHKLFKAVYEGLAFELGLNAQALSQVCGEFDLIRISGGNARWPFSVQLRADITDRTFYTMESTQSVCKGAAMLAGIACGIYKDYADAVQKTVKISKEYKPDRQKLESYKKQKAMYKKLYPSLKKLREI
jgi:xylulokinase